MRTVTKQELHERLGEILEAARRETVVIEEGGVSYRISADVIPSPTGEASSLYGSGKIGHQAMLEGLTRGRKLWDERDGALEELKESLRGNG